MNNDNIVMGFMSGCVWGGFVVLITLFIIMTISGQLKTGCDQILVDAAHERYEEESISDVLVAQEFICLEEHD